MEIRNRRSNFAQFYPGLWLEVSDGSTKMDVDVRKSELKDFAMMLMDIVDDCLRAGGVHDDVGDKFNEAWEAMRDEWEVEG